MKKVLAVVAVVCVMCVAGTALAQNDGKRHQPAGNERRMPPRMEQQIPGRDAPNMPGREAHCGHRFGHERPTFTPDMPKEIREKAAELAKLRVDLEEAMTSRPLNKQKALDVHAKIQALKQEIETWRFTKRLERIEARQKKGVPPAQENSTPAPEDTAETPAE